jgi:SAM-dependent methyltransferase
MIRFDYTSDEAFTAPRAGPYSLPIYIHRQPLLASARKAAPKIVGRVLDVGCGRKPYRNVLSHAIEYVGVDVASSPHLHPGIDFIYDGRILPFGDASFDSVVCTEVLEHCPDPKGILAEIARVLRPGGHLFLTVPFVYPHHEIPYDYFRFTRFGLESMAAEAGLAPAWIEIRGGVYAVWVQSTYLAISYTVGRFLVVDLLYLVFWPIARLALAADGWRKRDEITLGWQLLLQKTVGGTRPANTP